MRWALILLGVALLAVGATWLLDPGATSLPSVPAGDSSDDAAAAGRGDLEMASADAWSSDDERADEFDDGPDGDDPMRESAEPLGPEQDGPIVTVASRPVPGAQPKPLADVYLNFVNERDYRIQRRKRQLARWEAPEMLGQRIRTDEQGRVQLPRGRGRWLCSASHKNLFGYLSPRAQPGEHTLLLAPDESVFVHVVHEDRRPAANIPLRLAQSSRPNDSDTIWRGTSDARGKAVVKHLQLMRRNQRDGRTERYAIVAGIAHEPAILTEFEARPVPEEPVVITLPPLGTIEVQLVDHRGTPLLSPARVGFQTSRTALRAAPFPLETSMISQRVQKPAGSQSVVLEPTGLNSERQVYARFPHDRRSAVASTTGPSQIGGTERVEVKLLDRHCVFAGQLLGPDDEPFGNVENITVMIWLKDAVSQNVSVATIADGRFDLVLAGKPESQPSRMEFRFEAKQVEAGAGVDLGSDDGRVRGTQTSQPTSQWLGASVELPPWPPGARIELGTVRMEPLPPLCSGVVIDDLGQPIANASVNVQQKRMPRAGESGNDRRRRIESELLLRGQLFDSAEFANPSRGNRRQAPAWRSIADLGTRTGPDGSFTIFGRLPPGEARVRADTSKHFAKSLPLPGPTSNLQIRIDRNGVLRGRVLLPEWLPRGAVKLTMRPFDEAMRRTQTRSSDVGRRGGRFTLAPLMPGRFEMIAKVRNIQQPLAVVQDVYITPGLSRDGRLDPLDLRQSLHRFRLRAIDQAGLPMALDGPIQARLTAIDGTVVESGFRWQKGKAEIITPHLTAELTFFGRGFVPLTRSYGPGDHDVYLQTQQPAAVEVPGARLLCGPTRKIRISTVLQGDTGLPSSLRGVDQKNGRSFSFPRWDLGQSSGAWLEQSDLVAIPLMIQGKYDVILRAHATESTKTPQASVTLGTFELVPGRAMPTVVPLNQELQVKITEALRRIDKQHQDRQEQRRTRSR
ncbi:MAG: hypothetical protein AB8H80_07305 [Planctomycetota bacterium]